MTSKHQRTGIVYTADDARAARERLPEKQKSIINRQMKIVSGKVRGLGPQSSIELLGRYAIIRLAHEHDIERNPDLRRNRTWRKIAKEIVAKNSRTPS